MKKDNEQSQLSRRDFVKSSLAASVGVAVVAAAPAAVAAPEGQLEQPKKQQGYHLTDHILDYYKAAAL